MTSRKHPSVALWITVALLVVVPVLYIASFGPACWISERNGIGERAVSKVFWPIVWVAETNPRATKVVLWYASLGVTSGDSPFIVRNEIHWKKRVYADFSSLTLLMESTIKPSTGELFTAPDNEAGIDCEED